MTTHSLIERLEAAGNPLCAEAAEALKLGKKFGEEVDACCGCAGDEQEAFLDALEAEK
jgi:hypothetical protein